MYKICSRKFTQQELTRARQSLKREIQFNPISVSTYLLHFSVSKTLRNVFDYLLAPRFGWLVGWLDEMEVATVKGKRLFGSR